MRKLRLQEETRSQLPMATQLARDRVRTRGQPESGLQILAFQPPPCCLPHLSQLSSLPLEGGPNSVSVLLCVCYID